MMLPRSILRRAAADLSRKHAAEVVAVGEPGFDGDLVDGFVGERQSLACEAYARSEDVGGGGLTGVLAEVADEALDAHAGAFGEEVVRELCVRRAGNEREDLGKSLREGLRGRVELRKDNV
jgi:hypothetical protein